MTKTLKLLDSATFTLDVDYQSDLRFSGQILGHVSGDRDTGTWRELTIYRTKQGRYVAERIYHTIWEGSRSSHEAETLATVSEVIRFFGHSRLAKDLYAIANIDAAITIE